MSDVDKVFSRARLLGSGTPIQLRWEGSGDSIHAAALLQDLQGRFYDDGVTPIKYHAVINIYESEDSEIGRKAAENMAGAQAGANGTQTCHIHYNADITRKSHSIDQPRAHIMFVRNIMGTSGTDSQTNDGGGLLSLHQTALRNRSNSLSDNSQIRLGMSGIPGLTKQKGYRGGKPVNVLFSGFGKLVSSAKEGGLELEGAPNRKGKEDFDKGQVMKNDGTSLGKKQTFYLTFHN